MVTTQVASFRQGRTLVRQTFPKKLIIFFNNRLFDSNFSFTSRFLSGVYTGDFCWDFFRGTQLIISEEYVRKAFVTSQGTQLIISVKYARKALVASQGIQLIISVEYVRKALVASQGIQLIISVEYVRKALVASQGTQLIISVK